MSIFVVAKTPMMEYRWTLRAGQRARVGRSPWAEFCIEGDDELREYHCEVAIEHEAEPRIWAIDDASLVVDREWTVLPDQREQWQATVANSQLIFSRARASQVEASRPSVGEIARLSSIEAIACLPSAALLHDIGMTAQALGCVMSQRSAHDALRMLLEANLVDDGVRYMAACLPAAQRLQWCYESLQQAGQCLSLDARGQVEMWFAEPQESLRQGIAQSVDWNRKHEPCTWLLASIGWTGGSLSSNNSIPVPPTDQMIITGVITALNLTGAQMDLPTYQRSVIESGMQWLS